MITNHEFTKNIIAILDKEFNGQGEEILQASPLIQYLNIKTKSANRGSKSRAGLANQYAIYVLVEDYINESLIKNKPYNKYKGAQFSPLLKRMRSLPFGEKLQNHALNQRLNGEFEKFFPTIEILPIIRDIANNKYWFNENLLIIKNNNKEINISKAVLKIINEFIKTRESTFYTFIEQCEKISKIENAKSKDAIQFIENLLNPNVDARIFEIVSYSILKNAYANSIIYWGWSRDDIKKENLKLYKTGRTNANDGGIDFVMSPLGRFFQVTETLDVGKYFLDIDKVQRYPITFVVKSDDSVESIYKKIREYAEKIYGVEVIVKKYIECVDEVINNKILIKKLKEVIKNGDLKKVIDEIVLQSKVEFNIQEVE